MDNPILSYPICVGLVQSFILSEDKPLVKIVSISRIAFVTQCHVIMYNTFFFYCRCHGGEKTLCDDYTKGQVYTAFQTVYGLCYYLRGFPPQLSVNYCTSGNCGVKFCRQAYSEYFWSAIKATISFMHTKMIKFWQAGSINFHIIILCKLTYYSHVPD
jgi:hypothetical protein